MGQPGAARARGTVMGQWRGDVRESHHVGRLPGRAERRNACAAESKPTSLPVIPVRLHHGEVAMDFVRPGSEAGYQAVFQTMVAIVTLEGRQGMLPIERRSIEAIAHQIFDRDIRVEDYAPSIPDQLEQALPDPAERLFATRMFMTLPFTGGAVSRPQIDLVKRIADRLGTRGEEFSLLDRAARGSWNWFVWRLMKHGVEEYWNTGGKPTLKDWFTIFVDLIRPGTFAKPKVAERYRALRALPPDTLGGTLVSYYSHKGFALPGEKGGMNEKFALHDFYHIIANYPPEPVVPGEPGSVRGEMLVSVFTGGNKRYHPMDWVIVPLLQWHCAAPVITYKKRWAVRNLLDPQAYFHALRRGMEMKVNMMEGWDWWDHIHREVTEIRTAYACPPIDPALDGTIDPPAFWYDQTRLPVPNPGRQPMPMAAE